MRVQSLGWEDPLEKEMATYSSVLAWKISRTEELGGYSPKSCKESDRTEQLSTVSFSDLTLTMQISYILTSVIELI